MAKINFDYIERKVARSIVHALEYALIFSDDAGAIGLDSEDIPGSTDAQNPVKSEKTIK